LNFRLAILVKQRGLGGFPHERLPKQRGLFGFHVGATAEPGGIETDHKGT